MFIPSITTIWVRRKEANMSTKERVAVLVDTLKREKIVQKYCLTGGTHLSGCSTQVTPIMVWQDSIELNLITDRNYFNKFIDRIVSSNKDLLRSGYFVKSDGSTPSRIVFRFL